MRRRPFWRRLFDISFSLLASRRIFLAPAAGKIRAADSRDNDMSSGSTVEECGSREGY